MKGLTVSEYLDACYAVIVGSAGAFADPFKFRRSVHSLITTGQIVEDDDDDVPQQKSQPVKRQKPAKADNGLEKPPQSALEALRAMRDKVMSNNNNAGENLPVE